MSDVKIQVGVGVVKIEPAALGAVKVAQTEATTVKVQPTGGVMSGPARPTEVAVYLGGTLQANEPILKMTLTVGLLVVPNRCAAVAEEPADKQVVCPITLDGAPVGTLTFDTGGEIGEFSFTSTQLAPGRLLVEAPADPGGIGGVSVTISGER